MQLRHAAVESHKREALRGALRYRHGNHRNHQYDLKCVSLRYIAGQRSRLRLENYTALWCVLAAIKLTVVYDGRILLTESIFQARTLEENRTNLSQSDTNQ